MTGGDLARTPQRVLSSKAAHASLYKDASCNIASSLDLCSCLPSHLLLLTQVLRNAPGD
jgi:hypothetical protein